MPGDDYIAIPLSKTKLFGLLVGSALFVALGVYLFLNPDGTRYDPGYVKAVAVVAFVFFGLCGAFFFSKIFDDRPGLVLDRQGIIDNASGVAAGRVAWSDIRDVTVHSIRNQKFLILAVRNPERYLGKGNFLKQLFVRANYRMTGSPIAISSGGLSVGFSDLERLVRDFRSRFGGASRGRNAL